MSRYIIEKEIDEVKFKKVHLNIEECGDILVELTDEQLDQQLKEYSQQGLYVSIYRQEETVDGIKFVRERYPVQIFGENDYNFKPIEYRHTLAIIVRLFDVEIFDPHGYELEYYSYLHSLTDEELVEKVRGFLKSGYKVMMGNLEHKRKKLVFMPNKVIKEVTDDGEILYR